MLIINLTYDNLISTDKGNVSGNDSQAPLFQLQRLNRRNIIKTSGSKNYDSDSDDSIASSPGGAPGPGAAGCGPGAAGRGVSRAGVSSSGPSSQESDEMMREKGGDQSGSDKVDKGQGLRDRRSMMKKAVSTANMTVAGSPILREGGVGEEGYRSGGEMRPRRKSLTPSMVLGKTQLNSVLHALNSDLDITLGAMIKDTVKDAVKEPPVLSLERLSAPKPLIRASSKSRIDRIREKRHTIDLDNLGKSRRRYQDVERDKDQANDSDTSNNSDTGMKSLNTSAKANAKAATAAADANNANIAARLLQRMDSDDGLGSTNRGWGVPHSSHTPHAHTHPHAPNLKQSSMKNLDATNASPQRDRDRALHRGTTIRKSL